MFENLSGYIINLTVLCISSALCDILCSSSKTKGTIDTAVKAVCSACICIYIFAWIPGFINTENNTHIFEKNHKNVELFESSVTENTILNFETRISDNIFELYGIKPVSISIDYNTENSGISINEVTAILPESSSKKNISDVRDYLKNIFGENTDTIILQTDNTEVIQ